MQPHQSASPELAKVALARLEKALDEENSALANFNASNIAEFSRIKTQCLLELQRPAGLNPVAGPWAAGAIAGAATEAGIESLAPASSS